MNNFLESIDKQIASNRGKNLFLDQPGLLRFIRETVEAISKLNELSPEQQCVLIDYAADKAHEEFCRVNQYYSFGAESKKALRDVYADLLASIQQKDQSVDAISENHYKKLKSWLQEYNAFVGKLYENAGPYIEPVACSEYSAALQLGILTIDPESLMQPVLDVGCGKEGNLVKFLHERGVEVFGIDRFSFEAANLFTGDWLEFDYGHAKWGTIISNLGFSNHFNHHHLREDGNYIGYAKAYMDILHGLKPGGSFYYAPDLPFIEKYLDTTRFALKKQEVNQYNFKSTVIKRLG